MKHFATQIRSNSTADNVPENTNDGLSGDFQHWRTRHYERHEKSKKIGKDIAFGTQQTIFCLMTDWIDPIVGKWWQKKYGIKEQEVTNAHVWGGELIGDFSGLAVFVALRHVFRKPFDALARGVERVADVPLEKLGKKQLRYWAREHHVQESDAAYQQTLKDYKEFQAHNIVDSTLLAASSSIINVASQKLLLGNEQPLKVIVASKLIGTVATMGTMLGARAALPDSTKMLDKELGDRYFSKIVRKAERLVDGKPSHHLSVNDYKW
jgi:hypothetical protein